MIIKKPLFTRVINNVMDSFVKYKLMFIQTYKINKLKLNTVWAL